jgi:PAS domain S-box-containing protein
MLWPDTIFNVASMAHGMTGTNEPIRVLHVDDDADLAEVAATFVEREDDRFTVDIETSPSSGLDRLRSEPFDCVVSDYEMPTRNGIEFLELVREEYPDLPFILYTGKGNEEVASDAISAGVTDYLQKDSGTSQYAVLANRIRNAVDRYRAQTELADRETRLNLFFEQSPLGVVEWDEQFNFARMNDAAEDILGYSQDELVGHSWEKIVPESDRGAVGDAVSDLLENEGGYQHVNENIRKNGERVVCEWHNRVVTDDDGAVVAIFSQFQDITERRRQERENNRRRHRLEQILKTVPGCVVQLDRDGQFVFANDRAEEVLGLERDELTERAYNDPDWDIRDLDGSPIPDEDLPFRQVRETADTVYGIKHTIQWPDGTRKVLLVNGAPLFDDDGAVDSVVFSLSDITDQREQGRELAETQRRLELALEATDTGVFEWDMQTDDVVWSDSLERVMGLEPGEFDGTFEAFVDRVHPDDMPRVQEQIERATETDSMYQTEFRMLDGDGDYQWVEVRGRIIRDQSGERLIGIHHDITRRKERGETLNRQRSLLKAQQEAMIDGLVVVDENQNIISYNDRFLELWGIPEELVEQGDEGPPLEWAMDRLAFPEQFREKVEYLYENPAETARDEITLADGRVFDRYTAPVTGEDGTHYGRLWMFRDMTQRKAREEELERQNERLEEFASVVSHDLRNPLRTARGRLELATEECDSDHLASVSNAYDRMESIIDGLLSLAREGQDVGTTETVALTEVIEQTWAVTGADVETAALSLAGGTDSTPGHIAADRERLQRLLENLFRNAIEHSDGDVTVSVGALDDGFYVEDDGPGIPERERDTVFNVGYSSTDTGTGVGLSIVRRIAEGHGWTVRATAGSTGGARFEITDVEFAE